VSFCCECCVWSGRGLCDGLVTRPEESYRVWWVCVCVCGGGGARESSILGPWAPRGWRGIKKKKGFL